VSERRWEDKAEIHPEEQGVNCGLDSLCVWLSWTQ